MTYSGTYDAADLPNIVFDIVGGFMAALASESGTLATLIVLSIVVVLAIDLITGVFGFFAMLRQQR